MNKNTNKWFFTLNIFVLFLRKADIEICTDHNKLQLTANRSGKKHETTGVPHICEQICFCIEKTGEEMEHRQKRSSG